MPTGACGINCDVCRLRLLGTCSSCGSGKSAQAKKKLEAQKKIIGGNCIILECACTKNKEFCLRDCDRFPCENFTIGPYPFSQGFLSMQERRRGDRPPALNHHETLIIVPDEYWDRLCERDINKLCNLTLTEPFTADSSIPRGLIVHFLNEDIFVDFKERCLRRKQNNQWENTDDKLLELVTLLYLTNVKKLHPIGKEIVSTKDLKEAHFFKGEHKLKLAPLLERFGNDMEGFKTAAAFLEGTSVEMADAAYCLLPFPRIPLYYLYWKGDKEFKTKISVLFDRSIEAYFSADGIWGLVNLVSLALIRGNVEPY